MTGKDARLESITDQIYYPRVRLTSYIGRDVYQESEQKRKSRRLSIPLLVLLISTLASFLFGSVSYAILVFLETDDVHPKTLLLWILVRCYVWAALSPIVVLLARKYPVTRVRQVRVFFAHVAASVLFSLVHIAVYLPLFRVLAWPEGAMYLRTFRLTILAAFMSVFPLGILVYWAILGITTAIEFSRRYREEGARAHTLEVRLAEAQVNALRMQLQPHFLFNTLHSLSDLVLENPNQATRMIARLGDFLRMTLEGSGFQLVPLKREMDFVCCYLEIEQVRFHDRLRVHIEVDPQAESILVPNLILQPLVENAIRHGIARRIGPGRINIRARLVCGLLEIEIVDDGPGLDASFTGEKKQGIGLVNVRERVHGIYGDAGQLVLANGVTGGLAATLSLPISETETAKAIGRETLV